MLFYTWLHNYFLFTKSYLLIDFIFVILSCCSKSHVYFLCVTYLDIHLTMINLTYRMLLRLLVPNRKDYIVKSMKT